MSQNKRLVSLLSFKTVTYNFKGGDTWKLLGCLCLECPERTLARKKVITKTRFNRVNNHNKKGKKNTAGSGLGQGKRD